MPTIVSRKHEDNIQLVTPEIWQMMKENGMARRFKILDDSDITDTVKPRIPDEVKDFMNIEPEKIVKPLEALNIPELKSLLKEAGIKYEHGHENQYYIDLINNGN
jgi:hypothetical protein